MFFFFLSLERESGGLFATKIFYTSEFTVRHGRWSQPKTKLIPDNHFENEEINFDICIYIICRY